MLLLPGKVQEESSSFEEIIATQEIEVSQEDLTYVVSGPFNQAMHSIKTLFKSFQEDFLLDSKTSHLQLLQHEITYLRNAALQDRRQVIATNQHLKEEELEVLERSELQRGRGMETQIEAIMQQATYLVATEIETQHLSHPQEEQTKILSFYQEAYKLLDMTSPQNKLEREWEYAKYLCEENAVVASISILQKLPLPEDAQKALDSIKNTCTKEKLDQFFQVADQAETKNYIKKVSEERYRPKTLVDVVSQPTIMEVFLRYLNPVLLMRVNRLSHESVSHKLSREYVEKHANRALDLRFFSLIRAPDVCKDVLLTAVAAITQNGLEYKNLDPRLQHDVGIAKIALISILTNGTRAEYEKLVSFFPDTIQLKLAEYLADIKIHPEKSLIKINIQDKVKNNPYLEFIAKAYISTYPKDTDICRIMVQISGRLLEHTSAVLWNNPEIVWLSVQQEGSALRFASDALKNNETIVMAAVSQNWFALTYASTQMKDNEAIVTAAVTQNGYALSDASKRVQDNYEIVMKAVLQDGDVLAYASARLQDIEAIVLAAVSQYGFALKDASNRLQDNYEIVRAAVTKNWRALKFASDQLKDTQDIIMCALLQDGCALKYASDRLRSTEHIVMTAIHQDWRALEFASDQLRDTESIVIEAVRQDPAALMYASEGVRAKIQTRLIKE